MTLKRMLVGLVAAIVLGGMVQTASATIITIELDTEFSGATPPAGTAPWLTATFSDGGDCAICDAGEVLLTMDATNLTGTEFVGLWFFNIDPSYDPTTVVVSAVNVGDVSSWSLSSGANCCKADGDGYFDFMFDFPPPGGNRFTAGDSLSFLFTAPGLVAGSFEFLSLGAGNSQDGLYSAAHVQSIGATGDSGWITGDLREPQQTAPEPGGLLLLGAGLVSLDWMRRRMRSKK